VIGRFVPRYLHSDAKLPCFPPPLPRRFLFVPSPPPPLLLDLGHASSPCPNSLQSRFSCPFQLEKLSQNSCVMFSPLSGAPASPDAGRDFRYSTFPSPGTFEHPPVRNRNLPYFLEFFVHSLLEDSLLGCSDIGFIDGFFSFFFFEDSSPYESPLRQWLDVYDGISLVQFFFSWPFVNALLSPPVTFLFPSSAPDFA